jgi:hypothetical protein
MFTKMFKNRFFIQNYQDEKIDSRILTTNVVHRFRLRLKAQSIEPKEPVH